MTMNKEEFKDGLIKAIQLATSSKDIIGYDRLTILPNGKILKLDTGLNGVILSDSGDSSDYITEQRIEDASRDYTSDGIFSLNRKFKAVFQDNSIVLNVGGRASGKTKAAAVALLLETYKPKERNILALRFNSGTIKNSIYSEVEGLISKFELEDDFELTRDSITNITTKSNILFKGVKAGSNDVKDRLKGVVKLSYVLIEEAADLTVDLDDTLTMLLGSMRDLGFYHRLHLVLNPRSKNHAIYKRFLSHLTDANKTQDTDEAYVISSDYRNNLALSPNYLKLIERTRLTRPKEYDSIYLGKWKDIGSGQIIKNFEVGAYDEHNDAVIGVDFGFSDETAGVLVSVNHYTSTLYVKLLMNASGMTASDMMNDLVDYSNYKMIGDSARPEVIEEFKRNGFKMEGSKKGAGSVKDGLDLLQDYKIIIDDFRSDEVVECFNIYSWDERRPDKPSHKASHIPDALRYAFTYLISNSGKGNYHIDSTSYGGSSKRKIASTGDLASKYIKKIVNLSTWN